MRLIDVDLLIDRLAREPKRNRTYCTAIEIAANMPTAYDVDKVVEKLIFQTSGLTTWAEDEAYKLGLEKAVEIVKSGGIE